jgi:acetolactate synthase-1/2/3 large subunit
VAVVKASRRAYLRWQRSRILGTSTAQRAGGRKESKMAQIHGGETFVRMLEREGIEQVFGLHGGHVDPIFQACLDHNMMIYDARHEAAAGHMAEGWARATGRPGVVLVTAGPGVTNVVTAVVDAQMDAVPMIVVGGRHLIRDEERLSLQDFDGLSLMKPITKWARTVVEPHRIAEFTAMAFRQATTGRPGPVFLEIPMDVLFAKVDEGAVTFPEAYRPQEAPAPSAQAVEQTLALLAEAKRPLAVAGRGVWFARAMDELRDFAERTRTPVIANGMARGAVPEEGHPLGAGSLGTLANLGPQQSDLPDLILLLGARIGMFMGGGDWIPPGAKVIQVDIEGEEIGRNRDIQLGIVADCREALRAMTRAAERRRFPERKEWLKVLENAKRARKLLYSEALQSDEVPMHPIRLAHEVDAFLGEDDILVADGGETLAWVQMASTLAKPGHFISYGYLGCLGTGIPFGLAAQIANPNKRVLVITGDGSVGLNFAEFDTAVRHKLPIVVVVNNDQAWGMVKHEQELRWGEDRAVATDLGLVHYERAAEGFGVYGELVERPGDVASALERAFASDRPACINVMVDPRPPSPMTMASASAFKQIEEDEAGG